MMSTPASSRARPSFSVISSPLVLNSTRGGRVVLLDVAHDLGLPVVDERLVGQERPVGDAPAAGVVDDLLPGLVGHAGRVAHDLVLRTERALGVALGDGFELDVPGPRGVGHAPAGAPARAGQLVGRVESGRPAGVASYLRPDTQSRGRSQHRVRSRPCCGRWRRAGPGRPRARCGPGVAARRRIAQQAGRPRPGPRPASRTTKPAPRRTSTPASSALWITGPNRTGMLATAGSMVLCTPVVKLPPT